MAKPEWGTKHSCQSCGVKYYDLGRSPAVCPKCGTEFNPDALLRSRRTRPAAPKAPKPDVAAKPDEVADDLPEAEDDDVPEVADDDLPEGEEKPAVLADDESDEDDAASPLIEDPSELGEDDDDVADVVVGDDDVEET